MLNVICKGNFWSLFFSVSPHEKKKGFRYRFLFFLWGQKGKDLVSDCRISEISIFYNLVLKIMDILY